MENPTTTDTGTRTDTGPGTGTGTDAELDRLDRLVRQRHSLRSRHASALARLMDEREDLRGAHAFADLVDESMRWSA